MKTISMKLLPIILGVMLVGGVFAVHWFTGRPITNDNDSNSTFDALHPPCVGRDVPDDVEIRLTEGEQVCAGGIEISVRFYDAASVRMSVRDGDQFWTSVAPTPEGSKPNTIGDSYSNQPPIKYSVKDTDGKSWAIIVVHDYYD